MKTARQLPSLQNIICSTLHVHSKSFCDRLLQDNSMLPQVSMACLHGFHACKLCCTRNSQASHAGAMQCCPHTYSTTMHCAVCTT